MKVLSDMQGKRILVNPVDDYCNCKGDFIMAIVHMMGDLHEKSGKIEYKMPEAMAKAYLKARGSEDMKMHPNAYLCKVVNEEFGLRGLCEKVIVY